MKTIDETYVERLKLLVEKFGNKAALARETGKAPSQFSDWINGRPDYKTGKPRRLSTEGARELEEALGLPRGWFDQPITQNNTAEHMQVSNNYGNSEQNTIFYNLPHEAIEPSEQQRPQERNATFLKAMPLLDIDTGIDFAIDPQNTIKKIKELDERASTYIPHSGYTFGLKMPDDSLRSFSKDNISKGDILIVEPKMEPRHGDLVLVCLNAETPDLRRGLIAHCSFGLDNKIKIKYDELPAEPMPKGSLICGVVIEIKRRLVPTDKSRLNFDWDIKKTLQE